MESNFRLVLILLSAVTITAIFLHGLWTIRKNKKNPYKLKTSQEPIDPVIHDIDRAGFDKDGIGQIKVVGKNDSLSEPAVQQAENEATNQTNDPHIFNEPLTNETEVEEGIKDNETIVVNEPEVQAVVERKEPSMSFADPVTQPKPKILVKAEAKKLRKDQMNLEFGDPILGNDEDVVPQIKREELEPEVLILSVIATEGNPISGAALLPTLLTLGMRFGDMDIFHRHQDNAGNGEITFSCANMLNPGTFDIDNMENFVTQGVSLFMKLPNDGDAFTVFNQMLDAAKQLATEFEGQLLDDQRSVMTKQTEQHYLSKIREFDRKSRIASF